MATIVAAAGGGSWTTGATWVGGVAPTAADDAQLTNTSGSVTIATGAVCRSLDCTGYTGTLTHPAATTLTIGDATAGAGSVALKLVAGMTYSLGSGSTTVISFISTSATQQTITTGGKTLGSWTINGVGSSYLLADANTTGATGIVTLTAGTLSTGSQTCSWGLFSSSNSNVRALQLGASVITITGTGTSWDINTSTNMTLTAGTSSITATGNNISFAPGLALSYFSVTLTGAGNGGGYLLRANGTIFVNFTRTGTAVKNDEVALTGNATVTGTLTLQGNSVTNRLLVCSSTTGAARTWTITGATVVASNVDFRDTAFSVSTNLSAITGGAGDGQGNSNITFTTPTTRYAVAAGNWSSTTMWSTSSGGAAGASVPLLHDDVFLNASSPVGTYIADMPRLGRTIDFTGFTGTFQVSSTTSVYGSLTFPTAGTVTISANFNFFGRTTPRTFTSNGKALAASTFDLSSSGTYTLQDDLIMTGGLTLNSGTLNANSKNVTTTNFVMTGGSSRTLTMGQGIWSLIATTAIAVWSVGGTSFTVTANQATIRISAVSANNRTFTGGGVTYGTLTYTLAGSTGSLIVQGANTFDTINFSDASNARSLTLPSATTTTILSAFNVSGTSGKLMTIDASTAASAATLTKASGIIASDYLSIKDSTATGGATWYAGANSTSVSNNSGWIFTAAPLARGNFFEMF